MHYWNQRVHGLLDRFAAIELLNWCEDSIMAEKLSYAEQDKYIQPLLDLSAEFKIYGDGKEHYIEYKGKKRMLVVYPVMWSENSEMIPSEALAIPDKMIKYALPKVDAKIRNEF